MANKVFAPAKVNLTLHVTGQRGDGYHLLDSLVVFADVGDRLAIDPAPGLLLQVRGPLANGVPTDATNSILKAAAFLGQTDLAFTLEKYLPAAAGIGGGTADAAAALRGIAALRGLELPADVAPLGADVPVCLLGRAARMSGIGEQLIPLDGLPPLPALLVNPGVAVSTPAVFKGLTSKTNPPMPADIPVWSDVAAFAAWLAAQRNDLEAPAIGAQPVIADVLAALRGCAGQLLARMSGSGATCFALFENPDDARRAEEALRAAQPRWWVQACTLS